MFVFSRSIQKLTKIGYACIFWDSAISFYWGANCSEHLERRYRPEKPKQSKNVLTNVRKTLINLRSFLHFWEELIFVQSLNQTTTFLSILFKKRWKMSPKMQVPLVRLNLFHWNIAKNFLHNLDEAANNYQHPYWVALSILNWSLGCHHWKRFAKTMMKL